MIGNRRMTWRISMWTELYGVYLSVTLQAAVHLGRDYLSSSRSVKNQSSKSVKQLFRTADKLIKYQFEITGLSTIDWDETVWKDSSLLCDRAVRIMKSQIYGFSDSELCLGDMSSSLERHNEMVFGDTLFQRFGSNRRRVDGIRVDNFPRIHLEFSTRFKRWWRN